MVRPNHHYTKLSDINLFSEIDRKAVPFRANGAPLIDLGIGDVQHPLPPSIHQALIAASDEMGRNETFRGYGPSEGYLFLREAIAKGDYEGLGIAPDEIFVSDGANNDIANLQEIFAIESRIALTNPTCPVYIDTNVMAGRTRPALKRGGYGGVVYLPMLEENGFSPELPGRPVDLIYLCSPSNSTGTAVSRNELAKWVEYAKKNRAVIFFDGTYEAYVRSSAPRSIYEIEGAKEVAIEVRSFSKTAGFTGLRCSYTVVPHALKVMDGPRQHSVHALWMRRQKTKFSGVSYPVQRAAFATYSPEGRKQVRKTLDDCLERAAVLKCGLQEIGYKVYGGEDAPYLWLKVPPSHTSWTLFDHFLEKAHILSVPGSGFGSEGEGFLRLSAFAPMPQIQEATRRLRIL